MSYVESMYLLPILLGILLIIVFNSVYVVEQQSVTIIERFGKFNRTATAGLNFLIPFIERKAGRINLRVQQLDIPVETKTKDYAMPLLQAIRCQNTMRKQNKCCGY